MIKKFLALAVAIVAMAYAGGAMAHAKLRSSVPANHAVVAETPRAITLVFNEPAQLARLVLVTGTQEIAVKLEAAAKPAQRITVALPALMPGKYDVIWSALSPADGHVMKGTFDFTLTAK